MGTTPTLGWPYPDGTVGVAPDIVGDLQALALAAEASVVALRPASGAIGYAGTVADFNSGFRSDLTKQAGVATLTLNARPGTNGLTTNSQNNLVAVLPDGFKPKVPFVDVAVVYNSGWYGHTMHLQFDVAGTITIKSSTIGQIVGNDSFITGTFTFPVAS